MFCPNGYVTIHEVISRSIRHIGELRDGDGLISRIYDIDDGRTAGWLCRFHPRMQLIEKLVLDLSYTSGLFVCSPEGQILKIDVPFAQVDYSNFHLIRHLEEYVAEQEISAFFEQTEDLCDSYSHWLEINHLCEIPRDENDRLRASVADIWLTGNGQIPLYFDRATYTVNTFIFDQLSAWLEAHWSPIGLGLGGVGGVLRQFNGYSLCVSDTAASAEMHPEAIDSLFGKRIYSLLVGEDEKVEEESDGRSSKLGGRPNKSLEAARLVMGHFSPEEFPSWKEAVRYLEKEHNLKVHERTLQRGMKLMGGDKTQ